MDLLKRSHFLPRGILKNFYFKEILPAVKYGLVLWGSCGNSFSVNEKLHSRAASIIYGYGFGGRAKKMFSGLPFYLF